MRRQDARHQFIGSYNGTPVYDKDGQVELAIVTIRDITKLERAKAQLKDTQRRPAAACRRGRMSHRAACNDWRAN